MLRSHVKLVAKSQFISSCWVPGLLHFEGLSYPISDIRLTLGPVALSKVGVGNNTPLITTQEKHLENAPTTQ